MPSIWRKYGCADQSSVFMNSACTSSPPYWPGGRLIECSTTRSTTASAGRGPKLGEAKRRAKRYQPSDQSGSSAGGRVIGVVAAGRRDGEPRDAVADLPQAQAQPLRGRGAVEARLLQGSHENLALLLVEIGLQVRGHGGGRLVARHAGRGGRHRGCGRR